MPSPPPSPGPTPSPPPPTPTPSPPPSPTPTPSPPPSPTPIPSIPCPSNTHRIYRCVDSSGHHSVWPSTSCDGVATFEVTLGCLSSNGAAGSTPLHVCYSG